MLIDFVVNTLEIPAMLSVGRNDLNEGDGTCHGDQCNCEFSFSAESSRAIM